MKELENKLIELGYKKVEYAKNKWIKLVNNFYEYTIYIQEDGTIKGWIEGQTECEFIIESQKDIDDNQKLYDDLKKDLEFLKKC